MNMHNKFKDWTIFNLGDHAIVFALEAKMDVLILNKLKQLTAFVSAKKIKGILDIIPSYHTLTLVYDITTFFSNTKNANEQLALFSKEILSEFENTISKEIINDTILYEVPVCYENIFALDIENISKQNKISAEEIIQMHTSKIYDVYSIGFLPGFTYMGMVDEKINIARHSVPRKIVPAGSVGIAGFQTGIYPSDCPGGWQIIGRTPWKIFDPQSDTLTKFKVGDRIQFCKISKHEFDYLNEYA